MRKYGNVKVQIDGFKFDSKMEADYYIYLKVLKNRNEIKNFEVHQKIVLQKGFRFDGKQIAPITYTPDFIVIHNDGSMDYIDVKGVKTNEFKIKEKMLKYKLYEVENKILPCRVYCVTLVNETWVEI